jgi:hypothetical protein
VLTRGLVGCVHGLAQCIRSLLPGNWRRAQNQSRRMGFVHDLIEILNFSALRSSQTQEGPVPFRKHITVKWAGFYGFGSVTHDGSHHPVRYNLLVPDFWLTMSCSCKPNAGRNGNRPIQERFHNGDLGEDHSFDISQCTPQADERLQTCTRLIVGQSTVLREG